MPDEISLFSALNITPGGVITFPSFVVPLDLTFGIAGPKVLHLDQSPFGSNTGLIDFAPGLAGKDANAGRIAYQAFGNLDMLDMVGAGTVAGFRQIKIWDCLTVGSTNHTDSTGSAGSISTIGTGAELRIYGRDTTNQKAIIYVPGGNGGTFLTFFDSGVTGLGDYLLYNAIAGQVGVFDTWGQMQGCGPATNGRGRLGVCANSSAAAYIGGGGIYNNTGGWQRENANGQSMFYSAGSAAQVYQIQVGGGGALVLLCTFGAGWGADTGVAAMHASAFTLSSDKRFKKNIRPIANALETINKLQGVMFDWKDIPARPLVDIPGSEEMDDTQLGLIAQDVAEVLPEVVHTYDKTAHQRELESGASRKKGRKIPSGTKWHALDYIRIIPVLIEAIKELTKRLEILEDANQRR